MPEYLTFAFSPILWFVLLPLATWRMTNILQWEKIGSGIRKLIGIVESTPDEPDADMDQWIYPDNFAGKVFSCFLCLSVWIAGACTVVMFIFPPLLVIPAASAGAILIREWQMSQVPLYIEEEGEYHEDNY